MPDRVDRVELTERAEALLRNIIRQYGAVMFHQSGGCCDGSAPMCCRRDEFLVGAADVLLGTVGVDTPYWMSADQYEYWKHARLTLDVVPGRGSGFSLEAPEGLRFIVRSRLLTDAEFDALATAPPPRAGAYPVT
ncbi:DUF779 domain-containing protein [Nocardia sp. NPDC058518]|uniref:DUF779 domain-containing protein n=1 Tax=Nocardia sp. NPDC058518 TaxID=3346534 RepID=UPI00365DE32D